MSVRKAADENANLREAAEIAVEYLTDFLMERTVEAFEEEPEIDAARTILQEALQGNDISELITETAQGSQP